MAVAFLPFALLSEPTATEPSPVVSPLIVESEPAAASTAALLPITTALLAAALASGPAAIAFSPVAPSLL